MSRRKVAVALKYDAPSAPRVVAVGRGEVAQRIIEAAERNGVPLTDNPALAEALSRIPIDQEIPESLYRAVAEVLTFILRTSGNLR
jgi:flagellar biosynthesis protein